MRKDELMRHRKLVCTVALTAAGFLVSVDNTFGQTKTITISVNDPRPMAAAILKIEELSGIPVNYEDIPIYYSGDLIDVTNQARGPVPVGRRLMVAPMRTFSVPIVVDAATERLADNRAVEEALQRLISAYNSSNLPGGFELESYNGVFFVKPVRFRDADGVTREMTPLLSAHISIPDGTRNPVDTARALLSQIPIPSGFRVSPGLLFSEFGLMRFAATNEPAHLVIARFLVSGGLPKPPMPSRNLDAGWSYKLLLDSDAKWYALNVVRVPNSPRRRRPGSTP